ncbi:type II toxin-antitoxin system HipA family toxin [Corynebacterium sp. Marseille-P4321]|uniref:type II toxin-antitoxin system HipA family toxin n=1 Tax=Corynebacterium sp. Marseille-P4321 TaxID=2736603 RepID=UPI00158BE872|nr:HipA domain-containing protein [Corynebacterium sp. Marseille-P4321]
MIAADVYRNGALVGHFTKTGQGVVEFEYLKSAEFPIATSLPLDGGPYVGAAGALPPFFTNLLPEGRRLSALKRHVKASLDDELALLLEVGADTIGDIQIVRHGGTPARTPATISLDGELDFTRALTEVGIADPVAVPGVQDKASARTIAAPVAGAGTEFILKVSPPEFPKLVENEAACFAVARGAGFPLAKTQLLHDVRGRAGLLVTRFDRHEGERLHVEDAAQVMGLYPSAKYDPAMEEVAAALKAVSSSPVLTARSIAFQVALAWLTGNGDLHAKNLSVIWRNGAVVPAPIYDIPSTVPYGDATMALSVQGKKDNISARIFIAFCQEIGLPRKAAERVIELALKATEGAPEQIIEATEFDPRRSRDLRRVLQRRRRLWLEQ